MPKALRAVQLPGVVGKMGEICGRNMTSSVLACGGAGQAFGEVGGADFTYDTQIGPFVTLRPEEQDRRRAEQLVAVEQGALEARLAEETRLLLAELGQPAPAGPPLDPPHPPLTRFAIRRLADGLARAAAPSSD